jgi:uncharacterized protein (TIGR02145 family)
VPTAAEWDTLVLFLDPNAILSDSGYHYSQAAGIKMKEAGNSHWQITDTVYGTNESGFRALPGGYRNSDEFFDRGNSTGWWSSTETNNPLDYAYDRNIQERLNSIFDKGPDPKNSGFSVRCIKDSQNTYKQY